MLKKVSLCEARLQAPIPPPGSGGLSCHTSSMSYAPPSHSQVPRTKDRARSLQTLTHLSINSFPNMSHAWNKPLTMGPPLDLPSLALLTRPPAPTLPPWGALRAARCCRGEQAARNPDPAPAGGKPSRAERTHPNSGPDRAALPRWLVRGGFAPGTRARLRSEGRQPAGRFSQGLLPALAASQENCFNYRGGTLPPSFRRAIPPLWAVLYRPSLRAPSRATRPALRDELIITEKGN